MNGPGARPDRQFSNPLNVVALGDPFALRHRGRFYLYGTNDGPPLPDGRVIPVFRSEDLINWEPLGGALAPDDASADHWAPEVLAWNGRFYMVVSHGDVDRRGHALWVAVADRPEGPFHLRKRLSDPSERFSIDGSWLLDDDGRLYLFRCLDFVDPGDPPHGTGIVVQPMRDPLTPSGPPSTVLRAHSAWHLFESNRAMPLYEGRRFAEWTTIEGPAPARRRGRYFCGYSGGHYAGDYGTGEAVADSPLGPYHDLHGREGPLFATTPGLVEGPGHFSIIRPDHIHDWIVLHGRRPGESDRRVWLSPASWSAEGVAIGPLTDRPQAAPALPTPLGRFAEDGAAGWTLEAGAWRHVGDGLQLGGDGEVGSCRREGPQLAGDWALEVDLRFPEVGPGRAEISLRAAGGAEFAVSIPASPDGLAHLAGADGRRVEVRLPTLGDEPFDALSFHAILIRAESGRVEVRLDGVRLVDHLRIPEGPASLVLRAEGPAIFDAVAVARIA